MPRGADTLGGPADEIVLGNRVDLNAASGVGARGILLPLLANRATEIELARIGELRIGHSRVAGEGSGGALVTFGLPVEPGAA